MVRAGRRRIIDAGELLVHFSPDMNRAVKQYNDFVRDGAVKGSRKEYYPEEKTPYPGDDRFVEELAGKHLELMSSAKKKALIPLEEIMKETAGRNRLAGEAIRGGSRLRFVAAARKEFIRRSLAAGYKAATVALFLNCTDGYVTRIFNKQ